MHGLKIASITGHHNGENVALLQFTFLIFSFFVPIYMCAMFVYISYFALENPKMWKNRGGKMKKKKENK